MSDCLHCSQLSQIKIKCDGYEDVWVKVNLNNIETLVHGLVNRHPNNVIKNFEDAFVSVIKSFKSIQNWVVMGDFSINYDKVTTQQNISDYANHINSAGCEQLINKPTRIGKSSSSIIDHIHANSVLKKHILPIMLYEDISDHLPICAIVQCNPFEKTATRPLRLIISQDNIDLFFEDLSSALSTSEMRTSKNLEHFIT